MFPSGDLPIAHSNEYTCHYFFFRSLPSDVSEFTLELKGSLNKDHPEFNEKIQVVYDEAVGRYIVAKDDIKPFETVLSEDAYAVILHPEKHGMNCLHCLKRIKAAIGCRLCANVAFCRQVFQFYGHTR